MAVNERLVLFFVLEEVTGRRLGHGVPADCPRRDVKLSASPPCRLLDNSQGRSRKSIPLEWARTFDSQCINLRSRNVSLQIRTSGTRGVEGAYQSYCARNPISALDGFYVQLRGGTYRVILLGKVRGQEESYFGEIRH